MSDSISTLAELKAASQTPTAARNRLTYLFDEGKFTELDAYAAAGDSLAGVITAFGFARCWVLYFVRHCHSSLLTPHLTSLLI